MNKNDEHQSNLWFTENHTEHFGITLHIKAQLARRCNQYQTVEIYDTYEMGRMLVIDGMVMLTERDECAYHEMLVHIPMFLHPAPRRALIIGGGDGGSLREIVKHPSLQRVALVEIDRDVVELSREFLPTLAAAYEHPKVELVIGDAVDYLQKTDEKFDIIIQDGSDPVGPAAGLFKADFFSNIFSILTNGGLASGQLGAPFLSGLRLKTAMATLKRLFADAALYVTHTPTYLPGLWGFFLASKDRQISTEIKEVRYRTLASDLRYYNLEIARGAFLLPQYIRELAS